MLNTVRLYATRHWTYHYHKVGEQRRKEFFEHCAKRFFFDGVNCSEAWEIWTTEGSSRIHKWSREERAFLGSSFPLIDILISPVLLACRFGWLEILDHYETYQSSHGFSASATEMMNVAIRYGPASVVRWLLDRKVCLRSGQLELAFDLRQSEILQFFLDEDSVLCNMLVRGQDNLVLAVRHELKDIYQALIKKETNWNCRDRSGRTLLFHALRNSSKDSEILEDLLLKGLDPLARDRTGETPLSLSMWGIYQQKYAFSSGFGYHSSVITDEYDENFLRRVLESYEHRTACLLLRYGTNSMMRDVTIRAQWIGILDSIAMLPTFQSDPSVSVTTRSEKQASAPDDTMQEVSQTLLSLAALYDHEKAFRVLLKWGTDPACQAIRKAQKRASTVTHMGHSMSRQQTEGPKHRRHPDKMIDELRQGPLVWAAYTGNLSLVQSIFDQDMDPNIQSRNGQTPLYFAAQQTEDKYSRIDLEADEEAIVRLLLRKGALVTSADAYGGATVLAHAFKARYSEMAQILSKNGAQIPKGAIGGPMKQLWGTFDHGQEGIRERLLERIRAAQVNSLDLQPPISRFCGSGDPVGIAAHLMLGGTTRLLGDAILAACGDISDPTQ